MKLYILDLRNYICLIKLLFLASILISCSNDSSSQSVSFTMQEIHGRNEYVASVPYMRPLVYRAKVPLNWIRKDPSREESILDTTKPLCEFIIPHEEEQIHITIHSFPSKSLEERIPPQAQVARWKQQFTHLDADVVVRPQAYSGFSGFLFEGSGIKNEKHMAVLGWCMQLAPEHYSTLTLRLGMSRTDQERCCLRQMRADFTIKASGPKSLLEMHRRSIATFARSFEFIQEIPSST